MIGGNHPARALAIAILAHPAAALAGDDFYGANLEGMGRAAVGNPAETASLSLNPGAIALTERYDFEGIVAVGPTGGLEWTLAALDARTAPIGFGIAWRRTIARPPITLDEMPGWIVPGEEIPNKKRSHEITVALAVPALDRSLSFGVGGTLILRNDDRGGKSTTGNVDVGGAYMIDDQWTVGVAGRNLVPLPEHPDLATGITAGVHFREEFLASWAFDVDAQLGGDPEFPMSFRTGGELTVNAFRPRLGYRFEGLDTTHWITPGVGGENESGAIEYALAVPLIGRLRFKDLVHTFSLRVRL